MAESTGVRRRLGRREYALFGLGGAALSGIGDALILGRSCSGHDFDHATGVVPAHLNPQRRWRSLFNGVTLDRHRIQVGTLVGVVGIGILQQLGLRGIASTIEPQVPRRLATVSAAAFAVTGAATHLCCGSVILAYQRASETQVEPHHSARPSPRSATALLAVSATGALTSLAVFSSSQTIASLRRQSHAPTSTLVVTPLLCVMSTLLTLGVLPAPVGGWARPASMSIGLMAYFAVTATSAECRASTAAES
ncbi:MAG: DUF6796 family protein [Terracoccus sp.]